MCDVVSELCVECLFDSDCADRATCVNGECVDITPCENSLDCTDDSRGRTVCDQPRGQCVQCLTAADCPDYHDCNDNTCYPFIPCVNSLDCPPSMVCDTAWGRCLDCVRDADCGEGMRCVAAYCRRACDSDNDCTPHGLLCDPGAGVCAQCLLHEDCDEALFCSLGNCVPDLCRPGTGSCQDNAVVVCGDAGDGDTLPAPCAAGRSCLVSNGAASCEPWVCDVPGTRMCTADAEKVIDCAPDGLSYLMVQNCAVDDELCVVDECLPLVCVPGQERCDGDDRVLICSSDGTTESTVDECATDEYCDENDPACQGQVCPPGQPVCDEAENMATVCNARGNGYADGGTDCDDTDEHCVDGECTVNDCGNTVCPGASCVELGSTCGYLVDTDATRTKTQGETACADLGSGWGLCTSTQLCQTAMHAYLAAQGCACAGGAASCNGGTNVYFLVSDYLNALWTRNTIYPSCVEDLPCSQSGTQSTGAIVCCNG